MSFLQELDDLKVKYGSGYRGDRGFYSGIMKGFCLSRGVTLSPLGSGCSCNVYESDLFPGLVIKVYDYPINGDNVPARVGKAKELFLYPVWMGKYVMLQKKVVTRQDYIEDRDNVHNLGWWEEKAVELKTQFRIDLPHGEFLHRWRDSHSGNIGLDVEENRLYVIDWNYKASNKTKLSKTAIRFCRETPRVIVA